MFDKVVAAARNLNGSVLKNHLTVQQFFARAMEVARSNGRTSANRSDLQAALAELSPAEAKLLENGLNSYLNIH